MENKKQLIIIPPMSEALKKLHEVLEGISGDENIEISLIDDLKELSQFVGSSGQCLILASNAKKCATFLQDNKSMLAKNHCKTILFTPKEIPAKTLIKFTKVGLTESILESSPPKTFLYKVKLLLRSIKTSRPTDDAEKTVKSLEGAVKTQEESLDRDVKSKAEIEENVIDMDRGLKKKGEAESDEDAFDYGNPLKGKIKPQEESIDTHWKSNRKKDNQNPDSEEEGNMAAESELASIDMYYRGKQKKTDLPIEAEEGDLSKKSTLLEESSEEEKRRKSSYADVIDEGSMKQKRMEQAAEEEIKKEKVELVDLDLTEGKKKRDLRQNIEEETIPLFNRDNRKNIEPEAEKKKPEENEVEDLGGYLKGKITTQDEEEEPEIKTSSEPLYDNSDLDEDKDPSINLDLEAADKKDRRKDNEEESEDKDPHEGEVDKIDGNMIGDASTVDKIRTRMEGKSSGDDKIESEDDELELIDRKKSDNPQDEEALEKEASIQFEKEKKEREKAEKRPDEEELDLIQKAPELSPLLSGKEKDKTSKLPEEEEKEREALSPLEKLQAHREKRAAEAKKEEEKEREKKENTKLDLEPGSSNQTHTGQVDKIDTFYRSGEAKKKEQSWDNLVDKSTTLDLIPGKAKKGDNATQAKDHKDLGEMTIDYRKLKEEFDMISMGGSASDSGAIRTQGNTTLRNDDDEGSFKVVEIDPKSLDFSIAIINSIYQKDMKAKQIFNMLALELVSSYHAYPVFYTYKLSDKKFSESYNTFLEVSGDKMPNDKKEWWLEKKKDTALFAHFQEKSMNTWRCPEIVQNGEVWEDVELPSWAENELKTKYVELAFPYFDGIDRMGLAVVFFPEGIDPKAANGILTVLEMARTLFLDTIERYKVQPVKMEDPKKEGPIEEEVKEKKNVLSFFGGLFGKKKAG